MQRVGIATFGLDTGRCPPWLFLRMKRLARLIVEAIVLEFGSKTFIERLSDPFFFQSFGCILAFDWNASGLTTTTTAALKEALRGTEKSLGIFIAGGKGKTSRKTPEEIEKFSQNFSINPAPLIYASKLSAKVDNSAIQDGFQLYHHTFIFTKDQTWTVIQQGMNTKTSQARRYHWLSSNTKNFVEEPHTGITAASFDKTLNLIDKASRKNKELSVELVRNLATLKKDLRVLNMTGMEFDKKRLEKSLHLANQMQPKNFEELLSVEGVGPKTVRALSLISEIIYGMPACWQDPARYTYAHGGKDGIPYPVDRKTYDLSISILEKAVKRAKLGYYEQKAALKKIEVNQQMTLERNKIFC